MTIRGTKSIQNESGRVHRRSMKKVKGDVKWIKRRKKREMRRGRGINKV
jgi:hypothetical protein